MFLEEELRLEGSSKDAALTCCTPTELAGSCLTEKLTATYLKKIRSPMGSYDGVLRRVFIAAAVPY